MDERSKRKGCRAVGRERNRLPFGYHFVPAVYSTIDKSYKNVIGTVPQLPATH